MIWIPKHLLSVENLKQLTILKMSCSDTSYITLFQLPNPGASNLYHSLRFSSNLPRRQENPASSTPYKSIYRVPEKLRRLNENAYTPRVVSIGPFHHGKESLKPMEEHKKR
ncbi:hypothetical protein ACLB2K_026676 [Fragaria x ananassa]